MQDIKVGMAGASIGGEKSRERRETVEEGAGIGGKRVEMEKSKSADEKLLGRELLRDW